MVKPSSYSAWVYFQCTVSVEFGKFSTNIFMRYKYFPLSIYVTLMLGVKESGIHSRCYSEIKDTLQHYTLHKYQY